jgi:hypothetical protein
VVIVTLFLKHRLRLGLLVVALATLAAGLFSATRAQGLSCREIGNIEVCGANAVEFGPDEFRVDPGGVDGVLTLKKKGDPVSAVTLRGVSFEHRPTANNPFGAADILIAKQSGDMRYTLAAGEEGSIMQFKSQGAARGLLHVDVNAARASVPADDAVPLLRELGIAPSSLLQYDIAIGPPMASLLAHLDTDQSTWRVEVDLGGRKVDMLIPIDTLPLPGNKTFEDPVILRVSVDEREKLSGSAEAFTANLAGLKGVFRGITVVDGGFEAATVDFNRADNPDLPNLDPTNPDLVFRLERVLYKEGEFRIGGNLRIRNWQFGSAFSLTNQTVGLAVDTKQRSAELVITSTLAFGQDSVSNDPGGYPIAIRLGGKERPDGVIDTFGRGTFISKVPALKMGPLALTPPITTSLVFDRVNNFYGLEADKVSLSWGRDLGGASGVQTGFKVGIDKSKKLVFRVGGGTLNLPEAKSGILRVQLAGSVAVLNDVTTIKVTGKAQLNIPGNTSVAPTVEMNIRGGKGVRDTCTKTAIGCLTRFEVKLSAFELKIGGFGFTLFNPRMTPAGGVAADEARLKAPAGIASFETRVSGLEITNTGEVKVAGGSFELPPLQIGSFSLVGLKGGFARTPTGYEFNAGGTMPLPGLDPTTGAQKISANVRIRTKADGSFAGFGTTISFRVGSATAPGIPIGNTGFELLEIGGSFDVGVGTVKIGVNMRAGSQVKFGGLPLAIAKGQANMEFKPFKLTANAEITLLVFKVAQASMGIGAGQGFNGGDGFNVAFEVDQVIARGGASLRLGKVTLSTGERKTVFALTAFFDVGIRKNQIFTGLPPFNINLANARFEGGLFRRGERETVGLKGRASCCFGLLKTGIFFDLNTGKFDVGGVNDYKLIDAGGAPEAAAAAREAGIATRQLSGSEAESLGIAAVGREGASVLQQSIPVSVEKSGTLVVGIVYPEGAPSLRLQLPDGRVLSEQGVDNATATFVRETQVLTEGNNLAFALANAPAGQYLLLVDNAPAQYEQFSYRLNAEPSLANVAVSCGGVPTAGVTVVCGAQGGVGQATISWRAQDTDTPTATVRVGYVEVSEEGVAPEPATATVLAEGLALGNGSFSWDLREVPSGRYQLVVTVEDAENAPVHSVAGTIITVEDKLAPAAPANPEGQPQPGELLISWTPNGERDLAGYEIGFGIVEPGLADDPAKFIYSRDMGPKEVVVSATNVVDAKLWGLADDVEVFVGLRAYDQSGNASAWTLLRAKPWALAPDAWTPTPDGVLGTVGQVEVAFASPLALNVEEAVPAGLLELRREDGSLVEGRLEAIASVDGSAVIGLRLVPAAALRDGARYTAVVKGGAAGVTAEDGRQMPEDYAWSFLAQQQGVNLPVILR